MLFLTPDKLGVFVVLNGMSDVLIREGSYLLDSYNCNILTNRVEKTHLRSFLILINYVSLQILSLGQDIPVYLSSAKDNFLDLAIFDEFLRLRNHIFEEIRVISEFSKLLNV